jgi:hypothetical protein
MTTERELRAQYLQLVETITTDVAPGDLTTQELMALAALLIPAHRRVLAERPPAQASGGRRLRAVRNHTPAANAAPHPAPK